MKRTKTKQSTEVTIVSVRNKKKEVAVGSGKELRQNCPSGRSFTKRKGLVTPAATSLEEGCGGTVFYFRAT